MLLPAHLDDHLPQARYDSRGAKVPKVRHPVPGAQGKARTPGGNLHLGRRVDITRVRGMRRRVRQRRSRELRIDGRLNFPGGSAVGDCALSSCSQLLVAILLRIACGVIVAVTGTFVLVLGTSPAYRPLAYIQYQHTNHFAFSSSACKPTRTPRLLFPTRQAGGVNAAPLRIGTVMVGHKTDGLRLRHSSSSIRRSRRRGTLIH